MCLILFAHRAHNRYPLIVAANRDEFFNRPTEGARFWDSNPTLLAGRDQSAGGTWLGVSRNGRFAAVTNFRQTAKIAPRAPLSRGDIPRDFLLSDNTPRAFVESLRARDQQYNGFNAILGDRHSLLYYSNRHNQIIELGPGVYGLTNHLLDSPWPKVEVGKQRLATLISTATDGVIDTEQLLSILSDTTIAADETLPDTGIGLERERLLSATFISSNDYGTRCSTALIIDKNHHVFFRERSYPTQGSAARRIASAEQDRIFNFKVTVEN